MLDNIINDCCKFTPSYYKFCIKKYNGKDKRQRKLL
jgi:hypothetical protein